MKRRKFSVAMIALIAVYILASQFGLLFMKLGAPDTSVGFAAGAATLKLSAFTSIGLLLYICSFVLLQIVLAGYDLSYIVPLLAGLGYAVTLILAVLVLKEKMTVLQGAGMAFVLFGIVLMNIRRYQLEKGRQPAFTGQ